MARRFRVAPASVRSSGGGDLGKGPFDDDTAMDFVDALSDCDAEVRVERLRAAVLRVSRAQGYIDYTEGVQAVVAASLLVGVMPPLTNVSWVASLPAGLLAQLADDAVVAVERAHAPGSDLFELCSAADAYDEVWKALTPVLRTLRAIGEPEQDGLF
jgi:Domain of unknown function (DUF4259)